MHSPSNLTLEQFANLYLDPSSEENDRICEMLLTDTRAIISIVNDENAPEIDGSDAGKEDQLPDETYYGFALSRNFRYGIHALVDYAERQGEPKKWQLYLSAARNWYKKYEQWDELNADITKDIFRENGLRELPDIPKDIIDEHLRGIHPEERSAKLNELFDKISPLSPEELDMRAKVFLENDSKRMPVDEILAAETYLKYIVYKEHPEIFDHPAVHQSAFSERITSNTYLANVEMLSKEIDYNMTPEQAQKAALELAICDSETFLVIAEAKSKGEVPDLNLEDGGTDTKPNPFQ